MGTIGHDTDMMRDWSGNIENCASEYDGMITALYGTVDEFVSSDFTGGIAKELENSILSQRENFKKLSNFLNEVADLVTATSRSIDSDTEDLKQMIDRSGIIG